MNMENENKDAIWPFAKFIVAGLIVFFVGVWVYTSFFKKEINGFSYSKVLAEKKIHVYGASTKGNTLLQYYGITPNLIKYAVERSEHKWGKYTIGSGLEIISEQKSRKLNPDYFYVMPYGFIDEFVKREKKWLEKGGKFLLPYPRFKVVKWKKL